jgi:hypothetical protein
MVERLRLIRRRLQATSMISIDDALSDEHLLGAALGDPQSWSSWVAVLKAAFGLSLSDEQAQTFASVAGNRNPPTNRVRELWAIIGRRGGKSRIAAALAVYLAAFVKHHKLARGERGMVLVLAASQAQARTVFDYIVGFLEASPVLRQEIANLTATEVILRNGIIISVHSNSFRTIRGRTLIACIMDEVSFWRDETSALPDVETYRAVLPSLTTTRGMLVGISTGYRRMGLLYQKHRDHYGQDSVDTLVVQGSTLQFNQTLDEAAIAAQRAADPAAAAAEWDGMFRDDIASFLDDELIDAATEHGRPLELSPRPPPAFYRAFVDASGGTGRDAYSIAIAHKEAESYVIDLVRGTRPGAKFDPVTVTQDYAALCKEYRIGSVTGDNYASQWVQGAWRNTNIIYLQSDLPKSKIYLEVLPLFARGLIRLPDHGRLLNELRLLERVTHRGGRDSVDHPKGGHDDYSNAVCGVLRTLSNYLGFSLEQMLDDGEENTKERQQADADQFQHFRLLQHLRNNGVRI